MTDIAWQQAHLEQHARYVETAKRQVAEARENLVVARQKSSSQAIKTAESVLKTNLAILEEMESHARYIRKQFDYLNALESGHAPPRPSRMAGSKP